MSILSSIDGERRIAHFRTQGVVTDDDVLRTLRDAYSRDDYVEGMRTVWDVREVALKVTPGGIREMASLTAELAPEVFPTAVITEMALVHGLARMYELIRSGAKQETRIFRTVEEACAWLEIAPEELPSLDG